MTTIVTGFWIFRYNRLRMGMCVSGDIFQDKLYKLLSNIEGLKTYIDSVLVLSKGGLSKHIEQLRIIFGRLRDSGLKSNAPRFSFGLKGITYLGYLITREGIKHDPNKVQGIMDIGRPTTMTEV